MGSIQTASPGAKKCTSHFFMLFAPLTKLSTATLKECSGQGMLVGCTPGVISIRPDISWPLHSMATDSADESALSRDLLLLLRSLATGSVL